MSFHPKYRPDIDGLRAIAVLLVVGFHAFEVATRFIGVDTFFVISGYLISSILFTDSQSNRLSIVDFYRRHIKQIFPPCWWFYRSVLHWAGTPSRR